MVFCEYSKNHDNGVTTFSVEYDPVRNIYSMTGNGETKEYNYRAFAKVIKLLRAKGYQKRGPFDNVDMRAA